MVKGKDFIFIHIYKTGGISVVMALKNHGVEGKYDRHATISEIAQSIDISKLFKFCFVRNPYDLQVSLYEYIKKTKAHTDNKIISSLDFPQYVEWLRDVGVYRDKSPEREKPRYISQTEFIRGVEMDFIGRFEKIGSDFQKLNDKFNWNTKLPHLNFTKRGNWTNYYDNHSKNIIYELFKEDFNNFNYNK